MLTMYSLSHCISEEIPVRCYTLELVAVYYIRVALVLLLIFIDCFVSIPTLQ